MNEFPGFGACHLRRARRACLADVAGAAAAHLPEVPGGGAAGPEGHGRGAHEGLEDARRHLKSKGFPLNPQKVKLSAEGSTATKLGWLWVKTVLVPFWLVGEFTTHFRAYFSGDWDVHWGYGILTHGHLPCGTRSTGGFEGTPIGKTAQVLGYSPFEALHGCGRHGFWLPRFVIVNPR